ncbi:hypothetical protein EMGBS3_11910 [Anaerolineaceae bacterium]|nr:hypothetical protein EMGBS3_11910 [Anaerolineaceae bacterium]
MFRQCVRSEQFQQPAELLEILCPQMYGSGSPPAAARRPAMLYAACSAALRLNAATAPASTSAINAAKPASHPMPD